mgnify:CR=1 FL=1
MKYQKICSSSSLLLLKYNVCIGERQTKITGLRLPAVTHSLKTNSNEGFIYTLTKNILIYNLASIAHLLSVGLLILRPGFESGREISFLIEDS